MLGLLGLASAVRQKTNGQAFTHRALDQWESLPEISVEHGETRSTILAIRKRKNKVSMPVLRDWRDFCVLAARSSFQASGTESAA